MELIQLAALISDVRFEVILVLLAIFAGAVPLVFFRGSPRGRQGALETPSAPGSPGEGPSADDRLVSVAVQAVHDGDPLCVAVFAPRAQHRDPNLSMRLALPKLRGQLRDGDALASRRDRAFVFLHGCDPQRAHTVAARLKALIPEPGWTVGVVAHEPSESADSLLRRAEESLEAPGRARTPAAEHAA